MNTDEDFYLPHPLPARGIHETETSYCFRVIPGYSELVDIRRRRAEFINGLQSDALKNDPTLDKADLESIRIDGLGEWKEVYAVSAARLRYLSRHVRRVGFDDSGNPFPLPPASRNPRQNPGKQRRDRKRKRAGVPQ